MPASLLDQESPAVSPEHMPERLSLEELQHPLWQQVP